MFFKVDFLKSDRAVEFGGGSAPMCDFSIDPRWYRNDKGLPTTKLVMDFTKEFYLPDNLFDIVICRSILMIMPDDKLPLFLRETCRVIDHGGKFSVIVSNQKRPLSAWSTIFEQAGFSSTINLGHLQDDLYHLETFKPVKHVNLFPATIGNRTIWVQNAENDVFSSLLMTKGEETTAHETNLMRKLVQPGWKVLDVGAHVGIYTTLLSQLVGPTGRVLAFEPSPINAAVLLQNLKGNKCEHNVTLFDSAASDENKILSLCMSRQNCGDNRLWLTVDDPRMKHDVNVVRLDNIAEVQGAQFAKLDVQGAELHALRGLGKHLNNLRVIMMEYWPVGMVGMSRGVCNKKEITKEDTDKVSSELWSLLQGFSIYAEEENQLQKVTAPTDLIGRIKEGSDHFTGLVCVRPSSQEERALEPLMKSSAQNYPSMPTVGWKAKPELVGVR